MHHALYHQFLSSPILPLIHLMHGSVALGSLQGLQQFSAAGAGAEGLSRCLTSSTYMHTSSMDTLNAFIAGQHGSAPAAFTSGPCTMLCITHPTISHVASQTFNAGRRCIGRPTRATATQCGCCWCWGRAGASRTRRAARPCTGPPSGATVRCARCCCRVAPPPSSSSPMSLDPRPLSLPSRRTTGAHCTTESGSTAKVLANAHA